jgi:hypothetical protein
MAQIIKHRRGSVTQLKDVTARVGELVMATGSISDMNGPFLFVGETEGVAGAYRPVSKIYQGSSAPTISLGSHGSVIDGTPFYATGNKSLYVLSKDGNNRLDLTGNIEGNLISGVTINSLTGSRATFNTFVSSSALNVSGNTQMGGTLFVDGDTSINADLYITGNTIQTGSIDLTGNVTLGGNITIGNQTTDLVVFQGEVSSSILPELNNEFDLGSGTQAWRNLHVSGTAYVGILQAESISLSGITVFEDLIVNGDTFLGNDSGDNVYISGSTYVGTLTDNRVVIVGTNGLLEDDANFTFNGTELNIGQGDFTVQQSSGNVDTAGTLNVGGATTLESTLTVTGSTILKDNLSVSGTTTVSGATILQNTLQVNSTSELRGAVGMNSTLDVTGSAQFKSTINVDGEATLSSATVEDLTQDRIVTVGSGGSLIDSSGFTYNGTVFKIGNGQFEVDTNNGSVRTSGSLDVHNVLEAHSTTELMGAVGMNSTLDVTGSATFKSTIDVVGTASMGHAVVDDLVQDGIVTAGALGELQNNSGFTFNGSIFKVGSGNFEVDTDGDVRTSGSLTIGNDLTIVDALNVGGVLTVTGQTLLQSDLYVSGNLQVLGNATSVTIQSTTVELDDNIIRLNAYSPFERYAGFEVIDSGSTGVSASFLWDGLNDYWMFVSSSGQSSKLLGTTAGTYGSENSLTDTYFPIATGPNTIGDSLLRYSGTTLSFNTNKFTIDSGTGDTLVSGNFTLSYSGGTDNGTKTSAIMFRNSSNVVGFVSTTETTDVLDGVLGYKNSNGALVFSTVIDGGTY